MVIYLLKIPDSGIEAQKLHQPALFLFVLLFIDKLKILYQ